MQDKLQLLTPYLNSRVASGVVDLTGLDYLDGCHLYLCYKDEKDKGKSMRHRTLETTFLEVQMGYCTFNNVAHNCRTQHHES
jgi:hypothetical protein